jgi:sterol desaturase/sphingolipid hydroxylase (fatty acid hydroxylase superfamily)
MDGRLMEYLVARADAWVSMITKPHMLAAVSFLCSLLIMDFALRGWRLSWSRRTVAGVLTTLSLFHVNFLFVPVVWLASEKIKELYGALGIPAVPTEVWTGVPVWLMVPFAILAQDFANYCNHRLMHTAWLWPVHAIHHSDPDVTGLTAYRVHMLEGLVMWTSYTVLLTWLGLPADVIGLGAIFLVLHNIYVHINVDIHHGPFELALASPRYHRWHHADVEEAHGKNLANVFPFYDWAFGTYYNPGRCDERVGAEGVPENDVVQLLLFPLQAWARMIMAGVARIAERTARLLAVRA